MKTYIHKGIIAGKLNGVIPAVTPKQVVQQLTFVMRAKSKGKLLACSLVLKYSLSLT